MEDNQVLTLWDELKVTIDQMELDIVKNAKGNSAAGVRARKSLRLLKKKVSMLIKLTVELGKAQKGKPTPAATPEEPTQ